MIKISDESLRKRKSVTCEGDEGGESFRTRADFRVLRSLRWLHYHLLVIETPVLYTGKEKSE